MKLRPKYFIAVSRKEYLRRMAKKRKRGKLPPSKPPEPPPDHQWDDQQLVCQVCGVRGGPDSWQGVDPCVRPPG